MPGFFQTSPRVAQHLSCVETGRLINLVGNVSFGSIRAQDVVNDGPERFKAYNQLVMSFDPCGMRSVQVFCNGWVETILIYNVPAGCQSTYS